MFLKNHQTELTKKEYDYLTNFEPKTSNFYGLPKIHKNKEINEACARSTSNYIELKPPNNLAFRPIVAGPTCETHRLSNFIDILFSHTLNLSKVILKTQKTFYKNYHMKYQMIAY